ncbi:MAG: PhoPQ-activated protein PqaA family protein [Planctomycetaceae bacterium]
MTRIAIFLAVCLTCRPSFAADQRDLPAAIFEYAERAEPAYKWNLIGTRNLPQGVVHQLHLVSQTWHDIVWEHDLLVYEPRRLDHPEHMLLFVTGGQNGRLPGDDELALGSTLANLCGARVASLHQVPNQPLLGDRVEDDLITETWLKYLATGDETWPLLFPMVKSAHKAMDALEEFARSELRQPVTGFVITGGSKRGWTSWLTPLVDHRVIATAPIVIDTLNFPVQTKNQLDTWGQYSEQIADYTSKGLVKPPGAPLTEREERLWKMMDPYTYRSALNLPKLIVNGTNDRYWVVDAVKFYWDDLEGLKYIREVPNAGHGLGDGREGAFRSVAAFFRHAALGKSLPNLTWRHTQSEKQSQLTLATDTPPVAARLWTATSGSRDFREAPWSSTLLNREAGDYVGNVARAQGRHLALFGELEFDLNGLKYSLTTRVFQE